MAATMGSETTAAAAGQQGVVRRDPFAMLPFTGYNMSDYFQHWLNIGQKLQAQGATLPRIYCVNWFRKGADGKFVWPGYGDNMRVLKWMLDRADGKAAGQENIFGVSPRYEELEWNGLAFSREQFATVIGIDRAAWQQEMTLQGSAQGRVAGSPLWRVCPRRRLVPPQRSAARFALGFHVHDHGAQVGGPRGLGVFDRFGQCQQLGCGARFLACRKPGHDVRGKLRDGTGDPGEQRNGTALGTESARGED
jgi:hypothetical protein